MNALMALYDSELRDEVFTLMELAKIKSYTQFVGLHGSSEHGKRRAPWPGLGPMRSSFLSLMTNKRPSFTKSWRIIKTNAQPDLVSCCLTGI